MSNYCQCGKFKGWYDLYCSGCTAGKAIERSKQECEHKQTEWYKAGYYAKQPPLPAVEVSGVLYADSEGELYLEHEDDPGCRRYLYANLIEHLGQQVNITIRGSEDE